MEEGGWDLQAVVRGCNSGGGRGIIDTATASTVAGNYIASFTPQNHDGSHEEQEQEELGDVFFHFPDLSTQSSPLIERSSPQELDQFYKPFFPSNPTFKSSFSFSSSTPPLTKPHIFQKHQKQILSPSPLFLFQNNGGFAPSSSPSPSPSPSPSWKQQQQQQQQHPASRLITTNGTTRPKRRKNQQKSVVCHVPADGLSSDMWAWRKYGQKPIKGSPYPRGYYRCSSSKGCLARKQVERSTKDPGVFVITYTADHNHSVPTHRNSLAGSVRNKSSQQSKLTASPMHSSTQTKIKTSRWLPSMEVEQQQQTVVPKVKKEEQMMDDEDDGMLLMSDMQMLCEDDMMLLGNDEVLQQPNSVVPTFPSWPWISNHTHQSS